MVYKLALTDEVWTCGCSDSRSYVTILDVGDDKDIFLDRFRAECSIYKCSKLST